MPIPVLNATQAAAWDERARTSAAIPGRVLMEAAGRAVAQLLARDFPSQLERGVLVAAGHGNNGGDGWVVARALGAGGVRVWAAERESERSPDCEANRKLALGEGVELLASDAAWPETGVVVDALLGTGASGEPRGAIGELAQRVAQYRGPTVAVDGPTGLDLSTGEAHGPVRADLTEVGLVLLYLSLFFALTSAGEYVKLFVEAVEAKEQRLAEEDEAKDEAG